jgi:hypothetical protein
MTGRRGGSVAVVVAMAPAAILVSCNLDLRPYIDPVDDAAAPSPTFTGLPTPGDPPQPAEGGAGPRDASADGPSEGGAGSPKRVFVSSATVSGDFNAGAGADALCNQLADQSLLKGTYIAWVSARGATAPSRFAANATWALVDGTVVFPSGAALKSGPTGPIHLDERGKEIAGGGPGPGPGLGDTTFVWTGTTNTGQSSANCADFLVKTGSGLAGDALSAKKWTEASPSDCATPLHLYCFEQ